MSAASPEGPRALPASRDGRAALGDRGGFVLALVVLMLFAISVTGATGYLVVATEATLAKYSSQGSEALSVARAGLNRFVAEQIGVVGDNVSYAIGDGVALVTSRKVATIDSDTDMYYLRSEGSVIDIFTPASPARRLVGAYAYHHRRPLSPHAAWVVAAERAYADQSGGVVSGNDASTDPTCPGSGTPPVSAPITGAIARLTASQQSGGTLQGTPTGETWGGGFAQIYDSIGLRWDILSDPSFPLEFDGVRPNYGALPADSFPIVRVHGYFNPGSSWSGRGVLIVNGEFDAASSFVWEGIVLAGSMDDIHEGHVRGMLVAGLDGPNSYNNVYWRGTIRYYSCLFDRANESLSFLELIENTVFEAS